MAKIRSVGDDRQKILHKHHCFHQKNVYIPLFEQLKYSKHQLKLSTLSSEHIAYCLLCFSQKTEAIAQWFLRNKRFSTSNTFISNTRLKLAKKQAKATQHLEAEPLLFENYFFFHPRYHPTVMGHILTNVQKNSCACFNEAINMKM